MAVVKESMSFLEAAKKALAYRTESHHKIVSREQLPGFDALDMKKTVQRGEGAEWSAVKKSLLRFTKKYGCAMEDVESSLTTKRYDFDMEALMFRKRSGSELKAAIFYFRRDKVTDETDFLIVEATCSFQLAPEVITHTKTGSTDFLLFKSTSSSTWVEERQRAFTPQDLSAVEKYILSSMLDQLTKRDIKMLEGKGGGKAA